MKIGTRESRLALIQTEMFTNILGRNHEIVKIRSKGDMDRERPLKEIGGQGLFVNEINRMVLNGDLDCAVHSGKDLPTILNKELEVVSVFDWKNYHDVIVFRRDLEGTGRMKIGTSSPRREEQIRKHAKNWDVFGLRGNIDTRLNKLDNGNYDGIVLSEAAMVRMYPSRDYEILDESIFVPAPGQGIIAVIARKDSPNYDDIKITEDPTARKRWDVERRISGIFNMGCSVPNGILYNPETEFLYMDINIRENVISIRIKVRTLQEAEMVARNVKEIMNYGDY